MKTKSRRQFLRSAAASTAGVLAVGSLPAWARKKAELTATPLSVFGYSKVQLLDGPLRVQFDQNHKLFLNVDDHVFEVFVKLWRQRRDGLFDRGAKLVPGKSPSRPHELLPARAT